MVDVMTLWVLIWFWVTATFTVAYAAFVCAWYAVGNERQFGLFASTLQVALVEQEGRYADGRPSRLSRLQTR